MNVWAEEEAYIGVEGRARLAQRLHDEGLLYAVNRLVLHPLGLALGVSGKRIQAPEPEDPQLTVNGLYLCETADPEGIVYASDGQQERGLAKLRVAGHSDLAHALAPYIDTPVVPLDTLNVGDA